MDLSQLPDEVSCWKREKVLGAGGFGFVILWRNKENNETIALKQCRWGHDSMMTPKHRDRWKFEVDMMFRLNHDNVVKAISVPPELDVPATELPLLAMEYCTGGDLRKLLNKPENCCGLKEKCVRLLLKHVSSAVNYLHSMRIIHRDLKPENIVIQDNNGAMTYKLIDLGYAKELDQGSLCTSFVGTLQYLAPELFMSQKYSCTVDYWSFGLVTHEVITGLRPFLPDKSPAEWIPIIKQKSSSQIRAYLDPDKNIVFSQEISPHHHICSILKEDIESFLQLMLEYDAKKRGRCDDSSAFNLLDKILDKKVIFVFFVNTGKLISLSADKIESVDDFKKLLELKSGVPINEQDILLPKGIPPNPDKDISQFFCCLEDEDVGAFLFSKNSQMSVLPNTFIPSDVENMMRNPRTEVRYEEQRTLWSQAVFLSQQEYLLISKLIQAYRSNLIHLISKSSHSHKNTSKMLSEMNKVSAKSSFLKSSIEQDVNSYEKQAENGGFTSQKMFDGWKSSYENLKKLDLLKDKVSAVEKLSLSIDSRTIELQKMSYARSRQTHPLEDIHNKILDAYGELRRRSKDQRHVPHDNTDIVRLLCSCLQQSRSNIKDIMLLIRTTNEVKQEIEKCLSQISNILQEIQEWDIQICNWQYKRQGDLWKVIDALSDKIRFVERSSSPLHFPSSSQAAVSFRHSTLGLPAFTRPIGDTSTQNSQNLAFSTASLKKVSPPIIPSPFIKSTIESLASGSAYLNDDSERVKLTPSLQSFGNTSISSFVDKNLEDVNRVVKENESLVECFQQMIDTLKSDQGIRIPQKNGHKPDFKDSSKEST